MDVWLVSKLLGGDRVTFQFFTEKDHVEDDELIRGHKGNSEENGNKRRVDCNTALFSLLLSEKIIIVGIDRPSTSENQAS